MPRAAPTFLGSMPAPRRCYRVLAVSGVPRSPEWGRGRLLPDIDVPLARTPCEAVLGGAPAHHPERGADGAVVGHVAILDDQPMWDRERGLSILRIFASRTRAELDRLRAVRDGRANEERLERIIASASDGILCYGDDLVVQVFNAAAERILRCPAAAAIGKSVERFGTPAGLDAVRRSIGRFASEPDALVFVGEADGRMQKLRIRRHERAS
jgi:PAS domain-containing protein